MEASDTIKEDILGNKEVFPSKRFSNHIKKHRKIQSLFFWEKIFRMGQNAEEICEHSAQEPTAPQPLVLISWEDLNNNLINKFGGTRWHLKSERDLNLYLYLTSQKFSKTSQLLFFFIFIKWFVTKHHRLKMGTHK